MACGGPQALQDELNRGRVEDTKDTHSAMALLRPSRDGLRVAAIDILLRYTSGPCGDCARGHSGALISYFLYVGR